MLINPLPELVKQYDRWLLWVPVLMGVGIAVYFSLGSEPPLWLQVAMLAVLGIVWLVKPWRQLPLVRLLLGAVTCVSIGMLSATLRTASIDTHMLGSKQDAITVTGTLLEVQRKTRQHRIILGELQADNGSLEFPKLRLTIPKHMTGNLKLGDLVQVETTLLPLGQPVVPGGYDFRRVAFFNGIGAVGRTKELQVLKSQPVSRLEAWREGIRQNLQARLATRVYPIAAALIIGDKSAINQDTREIFAASGLAHLLAISGLHLSLIAALVFFLIRRSCAMVPRIAEYYSTKKIAAVASLPITAAYLALSGFGIPAQRAFIMICIVMLAIVLDRKAVALRLVSLAATLLLLIRPESLLSPSFVLSFAAVTALVAFYDTCWQSINKKLLDRPMLRVIAVPILGIVCTTIIATIATAPYSAVFFNKFTMQGVVANLLAVPLTSFCIIPLAFLCVLLPSWQLGFVGLNWAITILSDIAMMISTWPGAAITIPSPPSLFTILMTVGLLWVLLWQGRLRLWGLGPVFASVIVLAQHKVPDGMLSKSHMALRHGDQLLVLKGKNSFVLSQWQQHLGCKQQQICNASIKLAGINILPVAKGQYLRAKDISPTVDLVLAAKPLAKYLSVDTPILDVESLPNTATPIWFVRGGYKLGSSSPSNRPWDN